jgi:hypothetical protein
MHNRSKVHTKGSGKDTKKQGSLRKENTEEKGNGFQSLIFRHCPALSPLVHQH